MIDKIWPILAGLGLSDNNKANWTEFYWSWGWGWAWQKVILFILFWMVSEDYFNFRHFLIIETPSPNLISQFSAPIFPDVPVKSPPPSLLTYLFSNVAKIGNSEGIRLSDLFLFISRWVQWCEVKLNSVFTIFSTIFELIFTDESLVSQTCNLYRQIRLFV